MMMMMMMMMMVVRYIQLYFKISVSVFIWVPVILPELFQNILGLFLKSVELFLKECRAIPKITKTPTKTCKY